MPCLHELNPSSVLESYHQCSRCGSFHHINPYSPKQVYFDDYYSEKYSHSSIDEQVYNVDIHVENGRTKIKCVLDLIGVKEKDSVLEIACAPGTLLRRLRATAGFKTVVGIEVNKQYSSQIMLHGAPDSMIWGLFPECSRILKDAVFSLIVALDVFEHVEDSIGFLSECYRLLKPGGQLLMMLPIVNEAGQMNEKFSNPEHIWLHSKTNMLTLMSDAKMSDVTFDSWTLGHETVSALKK